MNRVSKLVVYGRITVAIANSFKLQQSAAKIILIEQSLAVTKERIDYTSKKK